MTSDSDSRPTGRDVKQARGEARQSGHDSGIAQTSPNSCSTKAADAKEIRELLRKWRAFKRRAFEVLVFFCVACGVVGFGIAIMGIRHG